MFLLDILGIIYSLMEDSLLELCPSKHVAAIILLSQTFERRILKSNFLSMQIRLDSRKNFLPPWSCSKNILSAWHENKSKYLVVWTLTGYALLSPSEDLKLNIVSVVYLNHDLTFFPVLFDLILLPQNTLFAMEQSWCQWVTSQRLHPLETGPWGHWFNRAVT